MANKLITITKINTGGDSDNFSIYCINVSPNILLASGISRATLEAGVDYIVPEHYNSFSVVSTGICTNTATTTTAVTPDTTAPTTPTLYQPTVEDAVINVNWTVSTDSESGFKEYVLWEKIGSGSWNAIYTGTSLSFTRNPATNGISYQYYVVAWDYADNIATSVARSVTPAAALDTIAPTAGILTWAVSSYWSSVVASLSWTAGSDNIGVRTIEVQMSSDGGAWNAVQTYTGNPPSTLSYSHSISRTNNISVAYRIAYYDAANNVSYSNTRSSIYDNIAPTIPSLSQPTVENGVANLDWLASTDGGSGIQHYQIWKKIGTGVFNLITTTTSIAYTDSAVTNGTTYQYFINAVDFVNNISSSSSTKSVTPTAIDTTAPSNVTNLTKSLVTSTTARLSWNAANDVGGIAGYNIYNDVGTLLFSLGNVLLYNLTGLTPSSSYYYKIKARDLAGNLSLAFSNTVTIVTSAAIVTNGPYPLGYHSSNSSTACSNASPGTGYWLDTTNFGPATKVYSNSTGTLASAGYYSDGDNVKYWNGSGFTTSAFCM